MVHNEQVKENSSQSTVVLLDSIFFYEECMMNLWVASHQRGIEDQLLVTSILQNLDDFSQFIRLMNRKNEEYERYEPSVLCQKDTIRWMEKFLDRMYKFFYCLSITECQKNRLFLIHGNLMNEIKYLNSFCKSYDNDRSKIWFAQFITCAKD